MTRLEHWLNRNLGTNKKVVFFQEETSVMLFIKERQRHVAKVSFNSKVLFSSDEEINAVVDHQ